MSDSKNSDPGDGFDLLDYPCDYQFKAMIRISGLEKAHSAQSAVREIVSAALPDTPILTMSSKASRNGRFESVSVTVKLQSRDELEAVYRQLSSDANVVMTL